MKRISKIIFISSVVFLVFCISLAILVAKTGFEFVDGGDTFNAVLLFGIPSALFLTLFRLNYSKNSSFSNTIQITLTIVFGVLSFFVIALAHLIDFCSYHEGETFFRSKENPSVRIIERDFGCGAVDSGPPSISHWIVEDYPLGLIHCTRIDTTTIDLAEWDRMIDAH